MQLNRDFLQKWIAEHPLTASDIDCITAVMLKILDGKCNMDQTGKTVMVALYEETKGLPGHCLDRELHNLIEKFYKEADPALKAQIHEKRVLAENTIPKHVMKNFKAMIQQQGLFDIIE